jgi:hypothetical protein
MSGADFQNGKGQTSSFQVPQSLAQYADQPIVEDVVREVRALGAVVCPCRIDEFLFLLHDALVPDPVER